MEKRNIVLAYHSVGAHPAGETGAELYAVPLERFKEQMRYVKDADGIAITFDDGDITNYANAYPILKEMRLKASFFIIGSRLGTPGYMGWNEIRELRDAGMVIGSHGMTHRILTNLSDEELSYELNGSKKILEDNLKAGIDTISIPRGFYNEKVIDAAKLAGYKKIFTSDLKEMEGPRIGRIIVRPNWDLGHFIKVLNSGYLLQDKAEDFIKYSLKKILGAKHYDRIRTKFLHPTPYNPQPTTRL